jgi:hypothetical protein
MTWGLSLMLLQDKGGAVPRIIVEPHMAAVRQDMQAQR